MTVIVRRNQSIASPKIGLFDSICGPHLQTKKLFLISIIYRLTIYTNTVQQKTHK